MTLRRLVLSSRLILTAGMVSLLAACSTTPKTETGAKITKVNPYWLADISEPIRAQDPSILHERNALLHGAISNDERTARQGNYFTIFWELADRQPVTVRLEYRQANSGLKVKTIEQEVTELKKHNVTKFSFIGEDYVTNGRVTSWRASLVRGKQTLADYKSYLWE
ncbi:hypothetical protein DES53_10942 [Roseimicrobium gellanilyticum]|uniref:Lipoprotein n=1 Tax=Roseimicrobium gellanilyticum TaxID=748857 RepID=A0A366HD29_9BACT|nr:hypothetical protein [Roseimicrobium gellanilyticum]RBP39615.1 hypothetical protein DES53_10942 [Roseimicrobium gellanilyticum]